jgi:hypothetical protein
MSVGRVRSSEQKEARSVGRARSFEEERKAGGGCHKQRESKEQRDIGQFAILALLLVSCAACFGNR